MALGRLGSRIGTVAPSFPAQGAGFLAGTRSGTTVRMVRHGRDPRVTVKLHAQLQDVPQRELVMSAPFSIPRDSGGSPALGPGGTIAPAPATPPIGTTPPGSAGGCACG